MLLPMNSLTPHVVRGSSCSSKLLLRSGCPEKEGVVDQALFRAHLEFVGQCLQVGGLRTDVRHVHVGCHAAGRRSRLSDAMSGFVCQSRFPEMHRSSMTPGIRNIPSASTTRSASGWQCRPSESGMTAMILSSSMVTVPVNLLPSLMMVACCIRVLICLMSYGSYGCKINKYFLSAAVTWCLILQKLRIFVFFAFDYSDSCV